MVLARCRLTCIGVSTAFKLTLNVRFVSTSIPDVKERQTKQSADVDKEMENLNKKLYYLETTHNNAQAHMEQIFKGRG